MSSYDPIRFRQHIRRNRQADLLGSLQVDEKLKIDRLLDGNVGGLSAFQSLVDIRNGSSENLITVDFIGYEAASLYELTSLVH